tara:strand:- start:238 stop:591 length:354 start_codon:yes stop_codon:yes gene_type:complete
MRLTINTRHYDAPKEHLVESLGLLPHWVVEYNLLNAMDLPGGESDIVQYMTKRYGFGELYRFDGEIVNGGVYKSNHEDDKDLEYVGRMDTKDGTVYFYPYAITALPTKDGYFITRLD